MIFLQSPFSKNISWYNIIFAEIGAFRPTKKNLEQTQ